jgi:tripartite-type tricarboxylate transporter receptor subunit TctC
VSHAAHRLSCLGLAGLGLALLAAPAAAAEDFYAGKQIRLIIAADPNGSPDIQGRILAHHMGKYIPGNPTFVAQNLAGTAGIKATSYMFNNAPRDGTVLAVGQGTLTSAPLTQPKEAAYDSTKLGWVGSSTRDVFVGYVWSSAPIQKFEDAFKTEVLVGGSAVGSFSIDAALLADELYGTKFKPIIGYKSSSETKLAVEKGEVHGVMATNWTSLQREKAWWAANKVRMTVQYGLSKNPIIPGDLPLFVDFAKNDADRAVVHFWISNLEHGKSWFTTPDVPADRLEILRRAFDATMKDPEFVKEIVASGETVDGPMTGEALAALVAEEMKTPKSVVDRISQIVGDYLKKGKT